MERFLQSARLSAAAPSGRPCSPSRCFRSTWRRVPPSLVGGRRARRRAAGRAAEGLRPRGGGGNHGAATHPRSSPVPIAAAAPEGRRGPSLALEFWVLFGRSLWANVSWAPRQRGREGG